MDTRYDYFAKKLSALLLECDKTAYRIDEDTKLRAPNLHRILKGDRRPTDDVIETLASYLGYSPTVMRSWRLRDEYSAEEIRAALDGFVVEPGVEDYREELAALRRPRSRGATKKKA